MKIPIFSSYAADKVAVRNIAKEYTPRFRNLFTSAKDETERKKLENDLNKIIEEAREKHGPHVARFLKETWENRGYIDKE